MYPNEYFTLNMNKLAQLQLTKCLTNNDMCVKTGLTRQTLNNLYKGKTKARLSTLIAVAKALEVNPNEIVKGGNANE